MFMPRSTPELQPEAFAFKKQLEGNVLDQDGTISRYRSREYGGRTAGLNCSFSQFSDAAS